MPVKSKILVYKDISKGDYAPPFYFWIPFTNFHWYLGGSLANVTESRTNRMLNHGGICQTRRVFYRLQIGLDGITTFNNVRDIQFN